MPSNVPVMPGSSGSTMESIAESSGVHDQTAPLKQMSARIAPPKRVFSHSATTLGSSTFNFRPEDLGRLAGFQTATRTSVLGGGTTPEPMHLASDPGSNYVLSKQQLGGL